VTTLRHIRAIAFLPASALIVIPALLVLLGDVNIGWGFSGELTLLPVIVGLVLIAAGLSLLAWTIGLFAVFGRGTLAPWDPTERLVVRGAYCHVRNPMISGVAAALLGEAVLMGSVWVLVWFTLFCLANALYISLVEERVLERRFGEEYRVYRRNVPAWIPHFRPWNPSGE
jgi:protein-S-isoprenylcysteine O-methyltransferase Ste14